MRSRSSRSRFGAGVISMIFWWRRCTEQSRSKRWMTLPGVREELDLDVARAHEGLLEVDRGSPNALSASRIAASSSSFNRAVAQQRASRARRRRAPP